MLLNRAALALPFLLLSGCADILVGTSQSVAVHPTYAGTNVDGATCQLSNDKGNWSLQAPGAVTVHRSYNALSVACSAPGYVAGVAASNSDTKGLAWANIIFGGVIGGAVDIGTGAAFDYPAIVEVPLIPLPPIAPRYAPST
jgi:uncharacterized protein YceK